MGIYVNPGNEAFKAALNSEIYVDKTGMLEITNSIISTNNRFIAVSRPRRFGKTMAADMLVAYYDKTCDSSELFENLKIAGSESYDKFRNKYTVIKIDMQKFLAKESKIKEMLSYLNAKMIKDLSRYFSFDKDSNQLDEVLDEIYAETKEKFIFIIDEWDCVMRVNRQDMDGQVQYLDFLRNLLKIKPMWPWHI